jgi:hypothetical protein
MERVYAVRVITREKVVTYGTGTYLGKMVPRHKLFMDNNVKTHCILLDEGYFIWGWQCWFEPINEIVQKYGFSVKPHEMIKVNETDRVLPNLCEKHLNQIIKDVDEFKNKLVNEEKTTITNTR